MRIDVAPGRCQRGRALEAIRLTDGTPTGGLDDILLADGSPQIALTLNTRVKDSEKGQMNGRSSHSLIIHFIVISCIAQ